MSMETNPTEYFLSKTGERSVRAIAKTAGLDQSTTNRQLRGDTSLQVETVIAICRAFHLDFADAFVAAGFITAEEAQQFGARFDLSEVSDLELSKEMLRRVAAGSAGPLITEPASEALIDDVLRSVEDARAQEKKSNYAAAADARADRTPGADGDEDDRAGL